MDIKQKKIDYNSKDEDMKKVLLYEINNNLLLLEKPSDYFNLIIDTPIFQEYPFIMLYKMRETEQSAIHHPEGNVWNHTMLVVDEAAKLKDRSRDEKAFMWAALLHDIGKPDTTKNKKGKITAYNHEKVGETLAVDFLEEFTADNDFIYSVSKLVRWHMQILHVVRNLSFADIDSMKKEVDTKEVALLGYCDRLGRLNVNLEEEKENIKLFLQKCEDA